MSVRVVESKRSGADVGLWVVLMAVALTWFALYRVNGPFWNWIIFRIAGLAPEERIGEAIRFFVFDSTKILLLLAPIIFAVTVLRSFMSVERTRALLGGRREGFANVAAAALGVVTPFCSCSAVPAFIGFVSAGVPLGVTLSFLIASPMVNEVALVLLFGMFGGAVIHGWVPESFFARYAGPGNPFAVPLAVVIGVPLYSNAAGVLPLVEALYAKGLGMGTLLAFMMAVVALSLPEMILLRRVLKPKLIVTFIGVVAAGILLVGYVFNAVL